jgi:hypothetical protein
MLPRYKVSDVVFLHEDCKEETRKKYKIIEIYSQEIPARSKAKTIQPVIRPVINRKDGLVERRTTPEYEYLIEPLTDGAGRQVKESDIEGEAE